MKKTRGSDDGIHRAGRQAARAADTLGRIDEGDAGILVGAARGIERQHLPAQQMGEGRDPGSPAGRTAIDRSAALG